MTKPIARTYKAPRKPNPKRKRLGQVIRLETGAKITLLEKVKAGAVGHTYVWLARVVCPDCPPGTNERVVKLPSGGRPWQTYTGYCPRHKSNLLKVYGMRKRRKRVGVERHESGADILWDEQSGQNSNRKVKFICRERDIGEHKDEVAVAVIDRGAWGGRCKPCRQRLRVEHLEVAGLKIRRDLTRAGTGYGWVTCPDGASPDCLKETYVKLNLSAFKIGRRTGRCKPCGYFRQNGGRGDRLPLTEAPVFFDRPLGDGVRVQCVRSVPENEGGICGVMHRVNFKSLKRRWSYATGFCSGHEIIRYGGNPEAYRVAVRAQLAQPRNGNRHVNGRTEKGRHGGAHNVKWTVQKEDKFLDLYEDWASKIKRRDRSVPDDVRAKLLLEGNSPSDVALDYVAQMLGVESSNYLRTVITRARKRRKENVLHSSST